MATLRDDLEELLGPEGLAALSRARGGRRAYIPKPPVRDGHWIVAALGRELADALAWRFGGDRFDVPLGPPKERNARIRELRASGRAVAEIAAEAGISERQVRRILRR